MEKKYDQLISMLWGGFAMLLGVLVGMGVLWLLR